MQDNQNDDSGESINPTEQNIGILNQDTLANQLRGMLFSDEQPEGNPEPVQQEGEDQTEDKAEVDSEASLQDEEVSTEDPMAEDGTEVLSHEEASEPSEQESSGVQKRIDKLTALRKTAEERAEALQVELESYKVKLNEVELSATAVKPTLDNPFADIDTMEKLKDEYEQARQLRYKCEESPDGFQIGDKYFDSQEIRSMKLNAMKAMEQHLPKQAEFIKARAHWAPVAHETYPWLRNKDSQEYKLASQVLKNFPGFKKFPDWEMFVGDYIRGFTQRNAQSLKKSAQPKSAPNMSVKPVSSSSSSSRVDATARNVEARYLKTGSREDLKKVVSKFL